MDRFVDAVTYTIIFCAVFVLGMVGLRVLFGVCNLAIKFFGRDK